MHIASVGKICSSFRHGCLEECESAGFTLGPYNTKDQFCTYSCCCRNKRKQSGDQKEYQLCSPSPRYGLMGHSGVIESRKHLRSLVPLRTVLHCTTTEKCNSSLSKFGESRRHLTNFFRPWVLFGVNFLTCSKDPFPAPPPTRSDPPSSSIPSALEVCIIARTTGRSDDREE